MFSAREEGVGSEHRGHAHAVVKSLEDLGDRSDPRAPCALLKCALVVAGVVDIDGPPLQEQLQQGLELTSWSRVPTGSGLGTSSILAACAVAVLRDGSRQQLVEDALKVEAELTTKGGWQDQVGGVYPGFKLAVSQKSDKLILNVKELSSASDLHFVLIYTGTARLARDILDRVLERWSAKEGSVVEDVAALVAGAKRSAAAWSRAMLLLWARNWRALDAQEAHGRGRAAAARRRDARGIETGGRRARRGFVWSGRRRVYGGRDEGVGRPRGRAGGARGLEGGRVAAPLRCRPGGARRCARRGVVVLV